MAQAYLGQLKLGAWNFAPKGWALCNGQLLAINQNQALFSLLGTTFGGDGVRTFALPDLRSRVPIHQGSGFVLGEVGGTETVSLNAEQVPSHQHSSNVSSEEGTTNDPTRAYLATAPDGLGYVYGYFL